MEDGGRRNSRGDGLRAGRNQRQKKVLEETSFGARKGEQSQGS